MPLDDTNKRRNISAKDTCALTYHLAAQAKRTATADKDRATRECVRLGVLFDHEKHPKPAGYEGVVYRGAAVTISLKVGQPGDALDVESFLDELAKHLKPAVIRRLVARHRSTTAAAHTFTSSLI
ncbi:MAG TPA: hypothetical protein VNW90_10775 [Acetobacteraceae bacterium]|nr:hypothetical protein [Acetobacteraceae bacterium]